MEQVRKFIDQGYRCRVVVPLQGREVTHPEIGRAMIDRVVRELAGLADAHRSVEADGQMVLLLSPVPVLIVPSSWLRPV
jgi:translation initiation factor IF-3